MSTKQSALEFLRENHTGAENAITGHKLCGALGMTSALMRKTIGELRAEEHPIASDRNGYFFATRPEEIEDIVSYMDERISEMIAAKEGLARALSMFTASGEGGAPE